MWKKLFAFGLGGKKLFGFVLGRKKNFAFGLTEKKNWFYICKKNNFELNIKTISPPPPGQQMGGPLLKRAFHQFIALWKHTCIMHVLLWYHSIYIYDPDGVPYALMRSKYMWHTLYIM